MKRKHPPLPELSVDDQEHLKVQGRRVYAKNGGQCAIVVDEENDVLTLWWGTGGKGPVLTRVPAEDVQEEAT